MPKILKIIIFLLPLLLLGFLFYFLITKVTVKAIDCRSQYGPCAVFLEEKLREAEGKPLLSSLAEAKEALKKEVIVSDFSIQYKIPDRLEVEVIETKSLYALKAKNSDTFLYVNEEGYGLRQESVSALPYVVIERDLVSPGEKVEDYELFALNIILALNSLYQVSTGTINQGSLAVDIPGSVRVIFPLEGDKDALLGALVVVLDKIESGDSQIDTSAIREVDLRFVNPVLR